MRQRVDGILAERVDQVEQQPRALDMAEEAVADARAFGRALDQPGNVGEHELAALVADDAELRAERRERIVADLGRGVGDRVEEGRLAGVGQADQADVGEQLQAQPHPHFLARHAGLVLARGAVGRGLVAGVAAAAHAALEEDRRAGLSSVRSASSVRSSSSARICVPTGTLMTRSSPPAPVRLEPEPPLPRGARKCWV